MDRSMDLHARLAELYAELAAAHRAMAVKKASDPEPYVDQHNSPLGARRHCRLVRSGELPGYRSGRRYLVRRADLDRYLEQHRIEPQPTVDADLETFAKRGGRAA
jgi:Helix-turn-helix domain